MIELEKIAPSPTVVVSACVIFVLMAFGIFLARIGEFWLFAPVVIILGLAKQLEGTYINRKLIKQGKAKILLEDLSEVTKFLSWWIISDRYGDSIWVNYLLLNRAKKAKLEAWLDSYDGQNMGDHSEGINSAPSHDTSL